MQHTVTINLIGMPGKRGPRRFVGIADNCATALSRAVTSMPEEVRKAWYRADWDEATGLMVSGLRKFRMKDVHKPA